jgi:DnaJ domain
MVLEVVPTAPLELIIRSYKRLALELHPDRNSKDDATEAFQLVCEVFGAKLILLSIIKLCVLKSNIEARSSLRDIEGRKPTASLRPHLPLHNTKSPLSSNHTNPSSASYFDSAIRSTQRSGANRRTSKVEARTWCTVVDQEECLRLLDLRAAERHSAVGARNQEFR